MSASGHKPTKQEALAKIEELAGAQDRFGGTLQVLTVAGAGAGGAALTAVFGATTLLALGPFAVVVAASALAVTAGGAAGVAAGYGLHKLVAGAGITEGRRRELLAQYAEIQKRAIEAERLEGTTEDQKSEFISSLRELVSKSVIDPDFALRLIQQTNAGTMSVSYAAEQIASLLREAGKKA